VFRTSRITRAFTRGECKKRAREGRQGSGLTRYIPTPPAGLGRGRSSGFGWRVSSHPKRRSSGLGFRRGEPLLEMFFQIDVPILRKRNVCLFRKKKKNWGRGRVTIKGGAHAGETFPLFCSGGEGRRGSVDLQQLRETRRAKTLHLTLLPRMSDSRCRNTARKSNHLRLGGPPKSKAIGS